MEMTNEVWRSVEGFEGIYEVSNHGRLKNKKRIRKLSRSGGRNRDYLFIILHKKNPVLTKNQSIHRLVAKAFIPNPENKTEVNHKDGNKLNNHYSNLEWCTRKENAQHASNARLLWNDGIHFNAKLNLKTVFKIKRELSKGIRQCDIARKYKIEPMTIQAISCGRSWKHIKI